MRIHRFYINQKIEEGKNIRIDDTDLLNQWWKVFRLKVSDAVVLFDGSGFEYKAVFELLSKKEAVLHISEKKLVLNKPKIELHIFQSIIKKDNFEWIVEKGTEIGVSAFHPIISERSEKKDLNTERLGKIVKEASEQSGRGNIPEVFVPLDLENAIENFDGEMFVLDFDGAPILSFPSNRESSFSSLDPRIREDDKNRIVAILIGPEGGWTEKEREFFKSKNIKSFSLGSQVLRAETAAIAISVKILL